MFSDRSAPLPLTGCVVDFNERAGVVEIWLHGEIDLASTIVDELTPFFETPNRTIRVDLGEVTFMDCYGIGCCLQVQREARVRDCELVFTNPQGIVARVIGIFQLESALLGIRCHG